MRKYFLIIAVSFVTASFVSPGLVFPRNAECEMHGKILIAQKAENEQKKTVSSGVPLIKYTPPLRGTPGKRVGGASRGIGDQTIHLSVLAPDHLALTTLARPTLYWYLFEPTPYEVELALNDENSIEPVLEVRLEKPSTAGIQRLELSKYGVELKPGIEYQWFICIILDPEHRSKDVVDSGLIQRIEVPRGLEEELSGAKGPEVPAIFAAHGIWYETLASLSDLIEKNPGDSGLADQRNMLFRQGGLSQVIELQEKKARQKE